MVQVKNVLLFSCCVTGSLFGTVLDTAKDLEAFLTVVAKEEEKPEFRSYYSKFLEKQSRQRKVSKRRQLRRYRSRALQDLSEHHLDWYRELEPYLSELDDASDGARKSRLFLTRYANFLEYRESKLPQAAGWWDTSKGYFKQFGKKVASVKDWALGRGKKSTKA